MQQLVLNFVNGIIPSVVVFIVGIGTLYITKGLNFLSSNKVVMGAVTTIASNSQLREIAKSLCVYAQKYVSNIAIAKLKYVIEQIENYCKQSGLTITKEQVLEIVQSTYDENKDEIKSNAFVGNLKNILDNNDNLSLIADNRVDQDNAKAINS